MDTEKPVGEDAKKWFSGEIEEINYMELGF